MCQCVTIRVISVTSNYNCSGSGITHNQYRIIDFCIYLWVGTLRKIHWLSEFFTHKCLILWSILCHMVSKNCKPRPGKYFLGTVYCGTLIKKVPKQYTSHYTATNNTLCCNNPDGVLILCHANKFQKVYVQVSKQSSKIF